MHVKFVKAPSRYPTTLKTRCSYLLPKQMKEHVLTSDHLTIPDDGMRKIIKDYTREAVRLCMCTCILIICSRDVSTHYTNALRLLVAGGEEPESCFRCCVSQRGYEVGRPQG